MNQTEKKENKRDESQEWLILEEVVKGKVEQRFWQPHRTKWLKNKTKEKTT